MTLRARLAVVAAVVLATIAASGYVLVRTVAKSQLQQIDQQLTAAVPATPAFARRFNPGSLPSRRPRRDAFGRQSSAVTDIYFAIVTSRDRTVLASPPLAAGQAPRIPSKVQRIGKAIVPETVSSQSGDQQWRAVLFRSPVSSQEILVAISLSHVDATTSRLRLGVLVAGVLIALVLLAAAIWVERLGIRPIADVAGVADAIVAGNRSRRAQSPRSGTEAAHLARAFNVMLDEQQADEDRLRQFVADASHELRTPVTVVQGFADLWNNGDLRDKPSADDAMRRIGREAARMAGLVGDLLLLARLDSGPQLTKQPVDVSVLVREVIVDASAIHPDRDIATDVPDSCVVEGDATALRQVIANLVTNALTHTGERAPVAVSVRCDGDSAILSVTDGGPGMDSDSARHAFDRFWRGDASRTRPGSGLGLAIVAAIAAAHGGTVNLATDTEAGTTVTVRIPGAVGNGVT